MLLFTADDGTNGRELWKVSDGKAMLLADLVPGPGSAHYLSMAGVPGGVLFMSDDGIHGMEPWFTDGTLAGPMAEDEGKLFGTHLLQDINAGAGSGGLGMPFTKGLGGTFFGATDGSTGIELWWLPPGAVDRQRHGHRGSTATATLTVTLSPASTAAVTVKYETVDGTATASKDYTAASGTLTFAAGETTKTVTIQVLADTTAENREAFAVRLTDAVRAFVADGQGQVTIVDDDGTPTTTHTQPVWHTFFAVDTSRDTLRGRLQRRRAGRTSSPSPVRTRWPSGTSTSRCRTGRASATTRSGTTGSRSRRDETVVIGDFDGDGKDDIATWLGEGDAPGLRRAVERHGHADGDGLGWTRIGFDPTDVLLPGDVNGDGKDGPGLLRAQAGQGVRGALDGHGVRGAGACGTASSRCRRTSGRGWRTSTGTGGRTS